jgi:hypothetical protein
VGLRRITRERDRATRERDRATRIIDFMTGMFTISDLSEARGNTVTAREILDKSSTNIKTGLAKDPEVQSEVMEVMSRTFAGLSDTPSFPPSSASHAAEEQTRGAKPLAFGVHCLLQNDRSATRRDRSATRL